MRDLFAARSLKPMLIGVSADAFDSRDYIYELKMDGERCVAYLDPAAQLTELRNKRDLKMLPKVPELADMHKQVRKKCILDGELMMMVNGRPDYSAIQRRSLMSNKFKIELEAKRSPASFVAFDMVYYEGEEIVHRPLLERKELLAKNLKENERVALSRFIEEKGVEFFRLAKENELEGIVAKLKDSIYIPGKRTKDWIKIKNLQDEDFVVCGWIDKSDHVSSLILGQFQDGKLIYQGHVTLGVSGPDFTRIRREKRLSGPPAGMTVPRGNEEAYWIEPELVCVVKYMERTAGGGLRQPVFKGLRTDKKPEECILDI
ncbi:RNA ligase family protein [Diplocloster agilis]|uniref:DNA ligase (ATP) n=1 Tax=Diplocloster agilis TaxID=2850323 RepID=A0A949JXC3_9FIRM|nr:MULTISPECIES: RNA ligase family protein [Lachnospiraceae]MBU9735836.1 DNA ligase [Diplocloster agilis]MBU9742816.1 DNA ligase [Diplocloster agilis]MCU6734184.1 DNA ligase [Suonthocola fibrivorans]SCJ27897.1 Putative DNA ligase-like protein Rv0938/MT0965 [uncultured Clostridium sp.]